MTLAGTTWRFNSSLNYPFPSTLNYSIDFDVYKFSDADATDCNILARGDYQVGDGVFTIYFSKIDPDNDIYNNYYVYDVEYNGWQTSRFASGYCPPWIHITGGTDVDAQGLWDWLDDSANRDLRNTYWVFGNNPSFDYYCEVTDLPFVCNGVQYFGFKTHNYDDFEENSLYYFTESNTWLKVYDDTNGWVDTVYKIVFILPGDLNDEPITDSSLYHELRGNATEYPAPAEVVNISYNGNTIASILEDGANTKTLKVGGKYCEDDIVVSYTKPSSGGGGGGTEYTIPLSNHPILGAKGFDLASVNLTANDLVLDGNTLFWIEFTQSTSFTCWLDAYDDDDFTVTIPSGTKLTCADVTVENYSNHLYFVGHTSSTYGFLYVSADKSDNFCAFQAWGDNPSSGGFVRSIAYKAQNGSPNVANSSVQGLVLHIIKFS